MVPGVDPVLTSVVPVLTRVRPSGNPVLTRVRPSGNPVVYSGTGCGDTRWCTVVPAVVIPGAVPRWHHTPTTSAPLSHYPGTATTAADALTRCTTCHSSITVPGVSSPGSFWNQRELSKIVHFVNPSKPLKSRKSVKIMKIICFIRRSQTPRISEMSIFFKIPQNVSKCQ